MPIHDWTRVTAGTSHNFHHIWITEIQRALNRGILPSGYIAEAEQVAGAAVADVLTLHYPTGPDEDIDGPDDDDDDDGDGGLAVAVAPPRATLSDTVDEAMLYAARQDRIVVRHATGDRVVALIELVSPGNKHKRSAVEAFVSKAADTVVGGVHLQVVDLFPPRRFDPDGMHGAVWDRLGGTYAPPVGKPLTAAAYVAARPVTCYVEPLATGDTLPDVPLFLSRGRYVNVPLDRTYAIAYADVPERRKRVIEGRA